MEHVEAQMQARYEAYDDAVNYRLAARAVKLWRETCDVEFIPSPDVLEGHIESAIQSARNDWTQASIDAAPLSLRRLGEMLSNKLDDDEWNNAEPLLATTSSAMTSINALLGQARAAMTDVIDYNKAFPNLPGEIVESLRRSIAALTTNSAKAQRG